jgi:hypothetical protein
MIVLPYVGTALPTGKSCITCTRSTGAQPQEAPCVAHTRRNVFRITDRYTPDEAGQRMKPSLDADGLKTNASDT